MKSFEESRRKSGIERVQEPAFQCHRCILYGTWDARLLVPSAMKRVEAEQT